VVELSGVKDIITKSLGTNNPVNTVRATIAGLQQLKTADQIAETRGLPAEVLERRSRHGKQAETGAATQPTPEAAVEAPVG
jgi:small subunit ribosomal protein S5